MSVRSPRMNQGDRLDSTEVVAVDLRAIGDRVRRAREASGRTQRELAAATGFSQASIARLELGVRTTVELRELDRIASALDIPLRELTRGNPVRDRMRVAARIAEADVGTREAALQAVAEILELDERIERAGVEDDPPRRPGVTLPDTPDPTLPPEEQGLRLATVLRRSLDLAGAPITDAAELVEHVTGADTATLPLPDGIAGFSATDPERGVVLVALATSPTPERQRFTCCHELGHLLFGDCVEIHRADGKRTPAEQRCDAFARHLLAPRDGIEAWLRAFAVPSGQPVELDLRVCALLARHFRVSLPVMLIQLRNMGLLTDAEVESLKGPTGAALAQRYGWGPQYQAEREMALRPRPPRRILERATKAYAEGRVGLRVVARLAGEKVAATEARLAEAGVTAPPQPVRRSAVDDLLARARPKE